ncbi:unnamed protein product [Gulo gulo]|uniref:Uncharacterized protein n=1 Tax=Gulo gulo TaxID=48420 RepID=A0A9X9LEP1_GULGU|nr:unnamed protein product [Gulo gulo]
MDSPQLPTPSRTARRPGLAPTTDLHVHKWKTCLPGLCRPSQHFPSDDQEGSQKFTSLELGTCCCQQDGRRLLLSLVESSTDRNDCSGGPERITFEGHHG